MINDPHEQFKGYCWPTTGDSWHTPAVHLNGCKEAVQYAILHKDLFHEVRIVGEDGKVVLQTIGGSIVFPVIENNEGR